MFACFGKLVRWFGRGRVLRVSRRASAVGHGVRRVSQRVSSRNLASIYIIRRAKRRAFNDASAEVEETNDDDEPGGHAATAQEEVQPPTENVDTEESVTGGSVNGSHEQRASRGKSKQGGYDEILKRRGPRRRSGPRIRYVDEGNRSGGTLEQSIRMGPVSVQRVENGETDEQKEAPPPDDPG